MRFPWQTMILTMSHARPDDKFGSGRSQHCMDFSTFWCEAMQNLEAAHLSIVWSFPYFSAKRWTIRRHQNSALYTFFFRDLSATEILAFASFLGGKRKKQFSVIWVLRISSCFPSKHGHSAQTRCHKKRVPEQNESHRVLANYIVRCDKTFVLKTWNLTVF